MSDIQVCAIVSQFTPAYNRPQFILTPRNRKINVLTSVGATFCGVGVKGYGNKWLNIKFPHKTYRILFNAMAIVFEPYSVFFVTDIFCASGSDNGMFTFKHVFVPARLLFTHRRLSAHQQKEFA
jgi:hypothetical protein